VSGTFFGTFFSVFFWHILSLIPSRDDGSSLSLAMSAHELLMSAHGLLITIDIL
jgi:hypothetical protein